MENKFKEAIEAVVKKLTDLHYDFKTNDAFDQAREIKTEILELLPKDDKLNEAFNALDQYFPYEVVPLNNDAIENFKRITLGHLNQYISTESKTLPALNSKTLFYFRNNYRNDDEDMPIEYFSH